MTHKVYVYGTLRRGSPDTVQIPAIMYDLGWYPGIHLVDESYESYVTAEVIEADDARLAQLDAYEGYREDDPEGSLYLRVPYKDGWIYTYNQSFDGYERVEDGDWEKHKQKEMA